MTNALRGAFAAQLTADEGVDTASLDAAVLTVAASVDRWATTGPSARAELIAQVIADLGTAADDWHAAACEAKGLDPTSYEGSEELVAGVGVVARYAQQLRTSLREIAETGRPRIPGPTRHAPGGRVAVGVVPRDRSTACSWLAEPGEVWMSPGPRWRTWSTGRRPPIATPSPAVGSCSCSRQATSPRSGRTTRSAELFVAGKVVMLKSNPVNDYLVEHWERAFKALINAGVLRIVRGGAAAGAHLVAHSLVDEVHVTGSDKTYDAIVFGPGKEGAQRKAAGVRLVTKPGMPIGSVSPIVIVPGVWTAKDLHYQASHVASMLVHNAGFNCLTPRVLITWRHWPQREAFVHEASSVCSRRSRPRRRRAARGRLSDTRCSSTRTRARP